MRSTAQQPILDSTAYPHLLDLIIDHSGAVSTLLAFRSVSRRCRKLADAKLFHHATLRREWYQPRRKGLVSWIWGTEPPPRKRRSVLVPAVASHIEADRPLPLLLDKIAVLDLVGAEVGEHKSYEFIARKRELRPGERSRRTELEGAYASYAPRVLRRFGRSPQEDWGRVLDVTADFVAPPGGKDYRNFRSVKVPLVSPRACWTTSSGSTTRGLHIPVDTTVEYLTLRPEGFHVRDDELYDLMYMTITHRPVLHIGLQGEHCSLGFRIWRAVSWDDMVIVLHGTAAPGAVSGVVEQTQRTMEADSWRDCGKLTVVGALAALGGDEEELDKIKARLARRLAYCSFDDGGPAAGEVVELTRFLTMDEWIAELSDEQRDIEAVVE
ncbi:uncharacterized protein LOC62_04G005279 [Vanrija pseudolonga]|uniref:F-box domain-containing protein n=1 Tax=Vanrija pseudolonga TaxID=143232 RepID=A0AAF0YDZ1_9TREE|nr:hypothetical protein LOC62_04G005279 [Vanrija pseudolonga]